MFHGIFTVVDVEHDMPLAMEVSMESDIDTMMIKPDKTYGLPSTHDRVSSI